MGDETRARIIAHATAEFGACGFKAATTRRIASRAGVKPAALRYYFGSKLDLYRCCVDQIANAIRARIGPLLEEADAEMARASDAAGLIACYCRLQDSLVDSFYAPGERDSANRLLTWESANETSEAQHRLRDAVDLPIYATISAIVGRILGRPAPDLETGLHVFALCGLFKVFHLDATRVHNALGWRANDVGNPERLKPVLREQASAVLLHLSRVAAARPPQRHRQAALQSG